MLLMRSGSNSQRKTGHFCFQRIFVRLQEFQRSIIVAWITLRHVKPTEVLWYGTHICVCVLNEQSNMYDAYNDDIQQLI
jgi:hypothetical protein